MVYQGRLLGKRPGSLHVAHLSDETTGDPFVFPVVLSATQRYTAVVLNGGIAVYDQFTGDAITVDAPDGLSYLTDESAGFRSLTLGTRTLLTNRAVETAKGTTASASGGEVSLVVVRQGNYGTTFSITLNGTTVSHLTPQSTATDAEEDIATDVIAAALLTLLDAETDYDGIFTFSRTGSTLVITPVTAGLSYTLTTHDGLGDEGLFEAKGSVQRFSDLPAQAPDGTLLEVRGDETTAFDNFWVVFSTATGVWTETIAPACLTAVDASTFPHVLEYQGRYMDALAHTGAASATVFSSEDLDLAPNELLGKLCRNLTDGSQGTVLSNTTGSLTTTPLAGGGRNSFRAGDLVEVVGYGRYFLFRQAPWADRTVGDTLTNPYPSFIGSPIRDLFVTQGRLGLIADSSVVLSRTAKPFDLFRSSVTQILADQPLDLTETLPSSSKFHAFTEWDGKPVIWTDLAQYELTGEPVLTPETVGLKRIGQYQNLSTCRPVSSGSRVFFVGVAGGLTKVMEFSVYGQEQRIAAQSLTDEIPTYLSGTPTQLEADDTAGVLLVFTQDGLETRLYAMTYVVENGQRVQQAWGEWTIGTAQVLPVYTAVPTGGETTTPAPATDPDTFISEDGDTFITEDGDILIMDFT
ncbi:phage stabilization protein [Caudoviricetes sp.]|nr:phage stabilization protein [Caudoviricetes sp.]